jgi:phage terminase small subunit
MDQISPKQDEFCKQYVVDYNATQAAIRAGYAERSAQQMASRLMLKDVITERIAEYQKVKNDEYKLNAEQILNRLTRIAEDGTAKDMARLKALELLGKHFQLFNDSLIIQEATKGAIVELPAKDSTK